MYPPCQYAAQECFERLRSSCDENIPGFATCRLAPIGGTAPPAPASMLSALRHAFGGGSAGGPSGAMPPGLAPRGSAPGRLAAESARAHAEGGVGDRTGARDMRRISSDAVLVRRRQAAAWPLQTASSCPSPGGKGVAAAMDEQPAAAASQRPRSPPPTPLGAPAGRSGAPPQPFRSPFEQATPACGFFSSGTAGSGSWLLESRSGASRPTSLVCAAPLTLEEAHASMPCSLLASAFVNPEAPEERRRSETLSQRNAQEALAALKLLCRASSIPSSFGSGGASGGASGGGGGNSLQFQSLPSVPVGGSPNPFLAAANLGSMAEQGNASDRSLPSGRPNPFLAALAGQHSGDWQ